jgi:hypothetical protein
MMSLPIIPSTQPNEPTQRVRRDFDWQAVQPEFTPEYVSSIRHLTGVQRMEMGAALRRMARSIKTAAIQRKHPEWSADQVQSEVSRIILLSASGA